MKLRNLFWSVAMMAVVIGCQEDEQPAKASLDDLSPEVRNFITMRLSSSSSLRMSGDAAVNKSFQSLMSMANGFNGGRKAGDSTETEVDSDTTIYQVPWSSCAVITEVKNDDGTTTITYDYGEGCEEGYGDYKYFMHGKYTSIYKYQYEQQGARYWGSYYYRTFYDNYGGSYYAGDSTIDWSMDGSSFYQGVSEYDAETQKFSGDYYFNDTTDYAYDGFVNRYRSKGKSKYNERGGVVEENEYLYGNDENFYHSKALTPLVSDYTCNVNNGPETNLLRASYVWIYTSGIEEVNYAQDGDTGTFQIDYGNGECDNIIFIIEDGVRTEVDLGEAIFYCGTTTTGG